MIAEPKMLSPSRIRIVAIDDEPLALSRLEYLLRDIAGMELVASCSDPDAALALISQCRPDLVLLDIDMPGLNGIELAEWLNRDNGPQPAVIFVTAFDHHALNAFKVRALDYVLKPVAPARLAEALERAKGLVDLQLCSSKVSDLHRQLEELRENPANASDSRDMEEI